MNIILRLAWRNLWRQPRRTWLTIGAMVFSNALLVFMISIQFSTYELMIDNTLQAFTGHLQVQASRAAASALMPTGSSSPPSVRGACPDFAQGPSPCSRLERGHRHRRHANRASILSRVVNTSSLRP